MLLVVGMLPPLAAAAQEDSQAIVLRVETPVYRWDESGLHVPGYATLDTPGAPALPMWSTVVELPPAGQWTLSVATGEAVILALDKPLPAVPTPQLGPERPRLLASARRSAGRACRCSISLTRPSTARTRSTRRSWSRPARSSGSAAGGCWPCVLPPSRSTR